jgi:pimeloyl-ACP methyl ester carboxylesterase
VSAPPSPPLEGTVLFVHGLWTTGAESFLRKRQLARHGLALSIFPYSSLAEPMDQVARRCARHAEALARRTEKPVHLVGHSLGGMVIYRMFETGLLAPDRFSGDFCRVVFMGTPARGSQSARVLAQSGPLRGILGLTGAKDLLQGLPPNWPFTAQLGIIAGNVPIGIGRLLTRLDGPNDGTVAVEETRLEGAAAFCTLPVTHTGMWLSPRTADEVAAFLQNGRFETAAQGAASR